MTRPDSAGLGAEEVVSDPIVLRLYLAGGAANSVQARENLESICSGLQPGAYELEIIDSIVEPLRALTDGVIVTPTLLKVHPAPACTIIGTLRDHAAVARALGIKHARNDG